MVSLGIIGVGILKQNRLQVITTQFSGIPKEKTLTFSIKCLFPKVDCQAHRELRGKAKLMNTAKEYQFKLTHPQKACLCQTCGNLMHQPVIFGKFQ